MKPIPMLYKIVAQAKSCDVVAKIKRAVTEQEAIEEAKKHILHPNTIAAGEYQPFVVFPLGTERQWKYGHINYCPRCGTYIGDVMGDPEDEAVNNFQEFECPDCDATVFVDIRQTTEE
ncbi:hypothetical protein [Brevibacillus laterosporus]|uniref:hypothetical protein n=1 Tax=Brevibacillus laterosporus TaxID=1465 RepID=UPI0003B22206|nr:hypothetical protein [Brevibacillus laterosporus]ERM17330.1 hypothetical protein P615_21300 [Brevibacillus laterosporus PE36]